MYKFYQIVVTLYSWTLFVLLWMFSTLMAAILTHQSMMDIKLSLACIPINFSFISKDTIFRIPILGAYMKASGHIPIKRSEDRKAYETLLTAVKKLTAKKSLVVFPEGTRSENGQLGAFKRGISLIILKSGRRVVPMA